MDVTTPRRPRWRLIAAVIVPVAAIAWAGWLLGEAWSGIALDLALLHWGYLAVGLGFGLLATLWGAWAFWRIFAAMGGGHIGLRTLGHYHFAAQLMKHLPGRFVGVAYQIAATRSSVSTATWIAASAVYMGLTLHFSIVVSCAVVVWHHSPPSAVLVIVLGMSLCLACWRVDWLASLCAFMEERPVILLRKVAVVVRSLSQIGSRKDMALIAGHVLAGWIVYFVAWVFYSLAYPGLSISDGLILCALYNIAWLAGYLSVVAPAGLGVRELVFVSLATQLDGEAVAYSVVVGRVSLLAIDVILGIIFLRRA